MLSSPNVMFLSSKKGGKYAKLTVMYPVTSVSTGLTLSRFGKRICAIDIICTISRKSSFYEEVRICKFAFWHDQFRFQNPFVVNVN